MDSQIEIPCHVCKTPVEQCDPDYCERWRKHIMSSSKTQIKPDETSRKAFEITKNTSPAFGMESCPKCNDLQAENKRLKDKLYFFSLLKSTAKNMSLVIEQSIAALNKKGGK